MSSSNLIQFNLNKFLKEIHLKKQHLKKMQSKALKLYQIKEKNYRTINFELFKTPSKSKNNTFIMYIVDISFSKKNTLLHISDCLGNIKFFYSAGLFEQKGKGKIARSIILRRFYKILVSKLKFLRQVPIAIHFKNADSNLFWFLKKLKKKLFITVVKHFNLYPYNGCRKKKIRRKKFKSGSLNV